VSLHGIDELTTEQAYRLVAAHPGHELPPLDPVRAAAS